MTQQVTCPACGARMRADRGRCLRCEAPLTGLAAAVPDDSRIALSARHWVAVGGGLVAIAAIGVSLVTVRSRSASPSATAVNRFASGPGAPAAASRAAVPVPAAPEPATALDAIRLAGAALSSGDLLAAKARYQQVLDTDANNPEALNGLGLVLERQGQLADAHELFARAAALSPGTWSYAFNGAHAAAGLQQWDDAVAGYREAARLFPGDYATEFNLALALHKKGDDRAAVPEFRKAIELAPGEPSFHIALAISLEKLGNVAEARREYQQYLEMQPTAPDAPQVKQHLEALAAQQDAAPPSVQPPSTS